MMWVVNLEIVWMRIVSLKVMVLQCKGINGGGNDSSTKRRRLVRRQVCLQSVLRVRREV